MTQDAAPVAIYAFDRPSNKNSWAHIFLLAFVMVNIVVTLYLLVTLNSMSLHSKVIIKQVIRTEVQKLKADLNNPETRDRIISNAGDILADGVKKAGPKITAAVGKEIADAFFPYDIFYIIDLLLNYDYTDTVQLYGNTMDTIARSFWTNPNYQDAAQVLQKISAVSNIVAQVQPLTSNSSLPYEQAKTVLGEWLLQVPASAYVTLYKDDVWRKVFEDCATLSNRFYYTNFAGYYDVPGGGKQPFNYNGDVKPAINDIYQFCSLMANTESVTKP